MDAIKDDPRSPTPNDSLISGLADLVAMRVCEMLKERTAPSADLLNLPGGIEPMRVYTAEEVAELLRTGMDGRERASIESVYRIDRRDLPRVRRIGTKIGFLGINILCYMHGLEPVDMEHIIEQYRARLMDERPKVKPLRRDAGETRLL